MSHALRLLAVAGLAAHLPVAAQAPPTVNPDRPWYVTASQRVERQSNPTDAPSGSEVADTLWTTTLGGGLNARFGRQRAYANALFSNTKYSRIDGLDSPGYDLNAGLTWETVGNLSGSLTASAGRRQADFNTGISTVALKNNQTFEELGARVQWGGVGLWGIEGSTGWRRVNFSASEFASREYEQSSASAGLIYRPSSVLTLGTGVALLYADYDVPQFGQTAPDSNERRDVYLQGDLQASGASVVGARLNFGKTDYRRANAQDISGVTGSAYWRWRPTGRTTLSLTLSRETGQESGFQRLTTGERVRLTATDFSRRTNALALSADYDLTGKVKLVGNAVHTRRSLIDSLTGGTGKDSTSRASLEARWAATRIITAGCNVAYETRSASGFGTFDYDGNTFGCYGQVTLD